MRQSATQVVERIPHPFCLLMKGTEIGDKITCRISSPGDDRTGFCSGRFDPLVKITTTNLEVSRRFLLGLAIFVPIFDSANSKPIILFQKPMRCSRSTQRSN